MTKPRVLQLLDSFNQGGSERQAMQLARLLHESGAYEVRVACLNDRGPLRTEAEALGITDIPVFPLTSFYDANFVVQLTRFVRYLRQHNISVVQSSDFYTNIFGMLAAALARVPARIAARREGAERSAFNRFIERSAYRMAQIVIANCETVRTELIAEGVPERKILTSYNGLDLAKFQPQQASRAELLASFGMQAAVNRRLVVIVANLRPVKDHATFLRAAQRVKAAATDVAFCLAGEGELLEPLREQAKQLGLGDDVFFTGRCARVAELLAVCDIGVLSSVSEGFSNAIIEYLAAGLPVVATDVGGAREAVIESETGFVVPSGNDELMAARIIELMNDPARARSMGQQARRMVEERFSNVALLNRTAGMYDRLLARRSQASRLSAVGYEEEIEGVNR
ncbi:MAG: glycosyltransferase [Blastocatellia bacterium]